MEVRVTFDGEADAAYIYLTPIGPGEVASTVVGDDEAGAVNLDFDREGRLIGIEILAARQHLPPGMLARAERLE